MKRLTLIPCVHLRLVHPFDVEDNAGRRFLRWLVDAPSVRCHTMRSGAGVITALVHPDDVYLVLAWAAAERVEMVGGDFSAWGAFNN